MKVHEKGDPRGPIPEWVGSIVSCRCGFRATLEMGDTVKFHDDQRDPFYSVKCPTCGQDISVTVGNQYGPGR